MADHLATIATQARTATRNSAIHTVAAIATDDLRGRHYVTHCHEYLRCDKGAYLTTRPATCCDCQHAQAVTRAEVLIGAAA